MTLRLSRTLGIARTRNQLRRAEELIRDPFAKSHDVADAIDRATTVLDHRLIEPRSRTIGRLGWVCLARLLDISAGVVAVDTADEDRRDTRTILAAARRYLDQFGPEPIPEQLDVREAIAALLLLPVVQERFRTLYTLPQQLDISHLTFHKTGTTSGIFRCSWAGLPHVALKATLPRFLDVSVIAEASEHYLDRFQSTQSVGVTIYSSGPRYVVMDFVEGETLAEYADRYREHDDRTTEERVEAAFSIAIALTAALGTLADTARGEAAHHLDLAPANVIIPARQSLISSRLIDFGQNHLLVEPIAAATSAVADAAKFVAPEIVDLSANTDDRSLAKVDAYSIGLLTLEVFAPSPRLATDAKLDQLWQWAPGLAGTVEDLIVQRPQHRLSMVPESERDRPFSFMEARLRSEHQVQLNFFAQVMPKGRLRGLFRLFARFGQIYRMSEVGARFRGQRDSAYSAFGGLAAWNGLAAFCWISIWWTCLSLLFYLLYKAIHLDALLNYAQGTDFTPTPFAKGHYPADLWGRVVAFSFGLMAFTYYTNIYATLVFPRGPGPVSGGWRVLGNLMARSLAVVTPAPCIFGAIFAPRLWPWATVFGVSWAALSNGVMYGLYTKVRHAMLDHMEEEPDPTGETRRIIKEWWVQMTYYAAGVLVLAGGLEFARRSQTFPVNNDGVYVIALSFLNIAFIVRLNCITEAPRMRGFLHRAAFNSRRVAAVAAEDGSKAKADGTQEPLAA